MDREVSPVYIHSPSLLSRVVWSQSLPTRPHLPFLAPVLTLRFLPGVKMRVLSVPFQLPCQLAVTLLCCDGDKLLSLMNLKHKSTQFLLFTTGFGLSFHSLRTLAIRSG